MTHIRSHVGRMLAPAGLLSACAVLLSACAASAPPCAPVAPLPAAEPVPAPLPAPEPKPAISLSLWNSGDTRSAIEAFVERVTREGGPDFVPKAARIAVFDNDGTLWSESPMYVQLAFALERAKELAAAHPEWMKKPAFKAAATGDMKALASAGTQGILEVVALTHGESTAAAFEAVVTKWLKDAKHPQYQHPYTDLTYAPMVELLNYLRDHGFKTFIVSGGGVAFMRPITETLYGIPPEQVIGSRIKSAYKDGEIQRTSEIGFIDDGPGKPVGIYEMIGRRPILTAGNSDGDLAMLEWTLKSPGPHLAVLVHHTDAEREAAYDREAHFGKLDKALDAASTETASAEGWVVIDMKRDWKKVFAFEETN